MSARRHQPGHPIDWPPMAELHRLHDKHGSWRAVGKALGVTERSIYSHLAATEKAPQKPAYPPYAELLRLRDLHGSWNRVADALGVTRRALYAHCKLHDQHEILTRLRGEVTRLRAEESRLRAMVVELGGAP